VEENLSWCTQKTCLVVPTKGQQAQVVDAMKFPLKL